MPQPAHVQWQPAVRGWRRRFRQRAEEIRVRFTELAHEWDPEQGGIRARDSPELDALEAVGAAAAQFVRLGLNVRPAGTSPGGCGRFEAKEFGDVWTGDGRRGPVVAGATAILFAFIDDFSRAVVGWRWGHAEDTVQLEAALRRGLEAAGVPGTALMCCALTTCSSIPWSSSRS